MNTLTIVLLVILVVLVGVLIALYFFGKKAQKKQEEQQAQIEAAKQTVSMLVIDKKRLRIKESGLPQMVIDDASYQTAYRQGQDRSEDLYSDSR